MKWVGLSHLLVWSPLKETRTLFSEKYILKDILMWKLWQGLDIAGALIRALKFWDNFYVTQYINKLKVIYIRYSSVLIWKLFHGTAVHTVICCEFFVNAWKRWRWGVKGWEMCELPESPSPLRLLLYFSTSSSRTFKGILEVLDLKDTLHCGRKSQHDCLYWHLLRGVWSIFSLREKKIFCENALERMALEHLYLPKMFHTCQKHCKPNNFKFISVFLSGFPI